jgi:hypothetical protein
MCREELVVDVATEPRNPDRAEPPPGRERGDVEPRNTHPADLGCVDWYLYPVNRNPRAPQLKTEPDLTLR